MNKEIACSILNIKSPFSKESLKKAYFIAALEYHPDKNNNPDATIIFQNITEAYNYLNNYINYPEVDNNPDDINDQYSNLINEFISITINKFSNVNREQITNLINCFKNNCTNFSIKIIEDLNQETIFKIWDYVNKFKDVLNFSKETLSKIENVIKKKLENNSIILLNPTLKNILNNDTFKLEIENEIFYVPLWKDLTLFETTNKKYLYVKCIPDLSDNINIIKENNNYNIHININTSLKSILKKPIEINIPNNNITIPTEELKIKNYQKFIFKNCGINNLNDQLESISIGSIIAHIYIDFTLLPFS
jgi:hypothetical protein